MERKDKPQEQTSSHEIPSWGAHGSLMPDIYDDDDPHLVNDLLTRIRMHRVVSFRQGAACNAIELRYATDRALDIRTAWLDNDLQLDEVPLAKNPDNPTEKDFMRLEQWFTTAGIEIAKAVAAGSGNTNSAVLPKYGIKQEGKYVRFWYDGQDVLLDGKLRGVQYILFLIEKDGREFWATELVQSVRTTNRKDKKSETVEVDGVFTTEGPNERGLGPITKWDKTYNPRTMKAAQEKFENERDEADDPSVKVEKQEQIDQIEKHLRRINNIHGRARKISDPIEKARKSVLGAYKTTLTIIEKHCKPLAKHFRQEIQIGVVCRYSPQPPIHWDFF